MHKLNLGDRVTVQNEYDEYNIRGLSGQIGVVRVVDYDFNIVQFVGWNKGHDGYWGCYGFKSNNKDCWCIESKNLKLVEKAKLIPNHLEFSEFTPEKVGWDNKKEESKMEIENVKKENIKKAMKVVKEGLANEEQEFAARKYRMFLDEKNTLERYIKANKEKLAELLKANKVFEEK